MSKDMLSRIKDGIETSLKADLTRNVVQAWHTERCEWIVVDRVDRHFPIRDFVQGLANRYPGTKYRALSASGHVIVEPICYRCEQAHE